jgi:hypothetical protein
MWKTARVKRGETLIEKSFLKKRPANGWPK